MLTVYRLESRQSSMTTAGPTERIEQRCYIEKAPRLYGPVAQLVRALP
jgi:hypothetical protein